jgi:hypothetical protein
MKRLVLIPKILLPLVLLMTLILPGCVPANMAEVSKPTVSVGEEVTLSIRSEQRGVLGCTRQRPDIVISGDRLKWTVEPSKGATVVMGVFVASVPGTYIVSVLAGNDDALVRMRDKNVPVTIVVQGKAAKDNAAEPTTAETAAAATTTTTKPSETTTKPDKTATEKITSEEAASKEEIIAEEDIIESDLPLTNEDLAGTYSMTVTSMGQSSTGKVVISTSGSSEGTIGGTAYTFSGDTLTYSEYLPYVEEAGTQKSGYRGTTNIKFIKSGDNITGKGTMNGFTLGAGDEVIGDEWIYEITMVKTG